MWFAVILLAVLTAEAALTAGGIAYTKRIKTKLLAEPKPTAASMGEIALAQPLSITAVQGSWLQVSAGNLNGWVFNGSVSATKPDTSLGADGLPLTATETSASAAARGLDEVVNDYATRHGLGNAHGDLDWLVAQTKLVTDENVEAYLKAQKKGEYK